MNKQKNFHFLKSKCFFNKHKNCHFLLNFKLFKNGKYHWYRFQSLLLWVCGIYHIFITIADDFCIPFIMLFLKMQTSWKLNTIYILINNFPSQNTSFGRFPMLFEFFIESNWFYNDSIYIYIFYFKKAFIYKSTLYRHIYLKLRLEIRQTQEILTFYFFHNT